LDFEFSVTALDLAHLDLLIEFEGFANQLFLVRAKRGELGIQARGLLGIVVGLALILVRFLFDVIDIGLILGLLGSLFLGLFLHALSGTLVGVFARLLFGDALLFGLFVMLLFDRGLLINFLLLGFLHVSHVDNAEESQQNDGNDYVE